jgi:hypothetical protein
LFGAAVDDAAFTQDAEGDAVAAAFGEEVGHRASEGCRLLDVRQVAAVRKDE